MVFSDNASVDEEMSFYLLRDEQQQQLDTEVIGTEFVRQYYTIWHEAPEHLYRFYGKESVLVRSGGSDKLGKSIATRGSVAIQKTLQQLAGLKISMKIRRIQANRTAKDGIMVTVAGELKQDEKPYRHFFQSFILVNQSHNTKNYFILNDVFNFLDEAFGNSTWLLSIPNAVEPASKDGMVPVAANANEMENAAVPDNSETSSESIYRESGEEGYYTDTLTLNGGPPEDRLLNGANHLTDETGRERSSSVESETSALSASSNSEQPFVAEEPVESSVPYQNGFTEHEDPNALDRQFPPLVETLEEEKPANGVTCPSVDALPVAFAPNVAEKGALAAAAADFQPQNVTTSPGLNVVSNAVEPVSTSSVQATKTWASIITAKPMPAAGNSMEPAAGRVNAAVPGETRGPNGKIVRPDHCNGNARANGHGEAQSVPRSSNATISNMSHRAISGTDILREILTKYVKEQVLFIGSLSSATTKEDIEQALSRFGKILSVEFQPDRSNLPKCGFVVFDSPDAAKTCLDIRGLSVCERRLNVQPVKDHEEYQVEKSERQQRLARLSYGNFPPQPVPQHNNNANNYGTRSQQVNPRFNGGNFAQRGYNNGPAFHKQEYYNTNNRSNVIGCNNNNGGGNVRPPNYNRTASTNNGVVTNGRDSNFNGTPSGNQHAPGCGNPNGAQRSVSSTAVSGCNPMVTRVAGGNAQATA